MPPTVPVRDAGHELVADIPIVLEVRNLVRASGSTVFKQVDPAIPDGSGMAAFVIDGRRRVMRV